MQVFAYRATERGIRERQVRLIAEQRDPKPAPQLSTWAIDLAHERERRRLTVIEQQRFEGLQQFRDRGMPEWALAILAEVADRHAICPSDIASRKRFRPIVEARQEAAYLIKAQRPKLSCPLIARWFGKDHTSICHLIACHQAAHDLPKLIGYDLERVRMRNREASAKARHQGASS